MEVRGQLWGVCSLPPPCGAQRWNLGHQPQWPRHLSKPDLVFGDKVLLCSPRWPWTHYVTHAGLSQLPKARATTPSSKVCNGVPLGCLATKHNAQVSELASLRLRNAEPGLQWFRPSIGSLLPALHQFSANRVGSALTGPPRGLSQPSAPACSSRDFTHSLPAHPGSLRQSVL